MIKPIIHTDGTSGEELFEQYLAAYHAINDAMDKVMKATPNGRDYYCHQDFNTALKEHKDRLIALNCVKLDMLELAEHCRDIMDDINRRKKERYANLANQ